MKKSVLLFLLCFFCMTNVALSDDKQYTLKNVEEKPVSKEVLLELWHSVALNLCNEENDYFGTTIERCRGDIDKKKAACISKQSSGMDKKITSKEEVKVIGKVYLDCVSPYFYCRGKEVKNVEEAKKYCK